MAKAKVKTKKQAAPIKKSKTAVKAKSASAKSVAKMAKPKVAAPKMVAKKKATLSSPKTTKVMAKKAQIVVQDKNSDIIDLILDDHRPLKDLIKVMKNVGQHDLEDRQEAFEKFARLLTLHAKPEERTMYDFMKGDEEIRELGFEGDVEHGLADQLVEEIKRTEDDDDLWSARVKVLADLVENHIEEEESDLLPNFRDHSELEDREELALKFLRLKDELNDLGGSDAPEEEIIEEDVETEAMISSNR
ncbi:MAG: hemerythrin domain-containing protein [Bdellovibrionales bacterium]|nr:hemerythrin domain-containing protein [Bdellovibrionales bacterium]